MTRTIKFYSGLSSKEFEIVKISTGYEVNGVLYGRFEFENFKTLKEVFNYIRRFYYETKKI